MAMHAHPSVHACACRILVNGYASLVNVLKQGLTIKTGVKVVKVDTSAAASVTVTAASGEKYTAK